MKEYKGYTIERITRCDWMITDQNGELVRTLEDRPTTKTLREAKELIDIAEREDRNKEAARCTKQ